MVSRVDLLADYLRDDAEILEDVRTIMYRELLLDRHAVTASVDQGVVRLEGQLERRTLVPSVWDRVRAVEGVVGIDERLTWAARRHGRPGLAGALGRVLTRPQAGARAGRYAAAVGRVPLRRAPRGPDGTLGRRRPRRAVPVGEPAHQPEAASEPDPGHRRDRDDRVVELPGQPLVDPHDPLRRPAPDPRRKAPACGARAGPRGARPPGRRRRSPRGGSSSSSRYRIVRTSSSISASSLR